ncbi:MAG: hypothetical protein KME42_15000 [Tildeniella nuda ZEHNDER 1965/U140]|nr:hypothetical protein [Tildeniella nuda ZEHNDER 1965/U140]
MVVSGQRLAVSGQRSAVSGQRSAVSGQPIAHYAENVVAQTVAVNRQELGFVGLMTPLRNSGYRWVGRSYRFLKRSSNKGTVLLKLFHNDR